MGKSIAILNSNGVRFGHKSENWKCKMENYGREDNLQEWKTLSPDRFCIYGSCCKFVWADIICLQI